MPLSVRLKFKYLVSWSGIMLNDEGENYYQIFNQQLFPFGVIISDHEEMILL